jgi:hypothetical protein
VYLGREVLVLAKKFSRDRPFGDSPVHNASEFHNSAGEGQFHWPEFVADGRLNVGSGVLDYQGRGYPFYVRGLGAAGIGISKIEAKGEIYGLERLRDFPERTLRRLRPAQRKA